MNKRKGMSLIVLVITILVMIILAGVVVVGLAEDNPISKANEAKFRSDVSAFKSQLNMSTANIFSQNPKLRAEDIDAIGDNLAESQKYIPSFTKEYDKIFDIIDGELVYVGDDNDQNDIINNGQIVVTPPEDKKMKIIIEVAANQEIILPLAEKMDGYSYGDLDGEVPQTVLKYDFEVDWGDGTPKKKVTSWDDNDKKHKYSSSGTYEIVIDGLMEGFSTVNYSTYTYNTNATTMNAIKEIKDFGEVGIVWMVFEECNNLSKIASPRNRSFEKIEYLISTFYATPITEIPDKFLHSALKLKVVSEAFYECYNLTRIPDDLFAKNTKLRSLNYVFVDSYNIENIPPKLISNCPEINSLRNTFEGLEKVKYISEDFFANNIELVNVGDAFKYVDGIKSIPEKLFANNTKLEDVNETFKGCDSLEYVPKNLFDNNPNLKRVKSLFKGCHNISGEVPELWHRQKILDQGYANYKQCYHELDPNKVTNYDKIPSDWL